MAPGALHSRDLPPGIETGTAAASQSPYDPGVGR